MEIRFECGSATKFWVLDLFYNSDPKDENRHAIEREIESHELALDGEDETPEITYDYEQRPDEYEVFEDGVLVKKLRYVVTRKIAIFAFKAPRTGKVIAQMKEI